ncbi:MAG TPA: sodium:calcium antiporter [SAR86 cluster bacterium]|jgi:cation:H+ antiporter|nr:sodium:calcium antiporter [SAR86 cluster bacterium]HJM15322.1 sodium:calcium antiporter [SAR86 cluster bacterium]|tara:strand:- start:3851 stop:4798 length:948 start_codon:yes stop_codon:yes gene_type:complete
MTIAFASIISGIALIWISAEKLEKYSVLSAKQFGMSPFLIGSTVIAFGTSAPEMLTTLFVSLEDQGAMVIGNVIGSNVANLSLVFGSMLFVVSIKKLSISQPQTINKNLLILLASSLLVWGVIAIDPFNIITSIILLIALLAVISFWYKNNQEMPDAEDKNSSKNSFNKLILSLVALVFAAWLITTGANLILENFNLGQLFIGYTVLAIGTSLPEIAASVSLALKGRYEAVAGTLIGSNIFNGLCVLAIPGLFRSSKMGLGWQYSDWSSLLVILFAITVLFCTYIFMLSKQARRAGLLLSILFLSIYFISLIYAY